ncbi:hypothetical protein [Paenirhodobacter sp.]|uniref:hypothetical protein n=1 Tax=Paenirhodobacter sp. TaxID=1965326 RepID=UPI003B3E357A
MAEAQPARQARGPKTQRRPPSEADQWQAHVTREAALEIGKWLEARGRLHQPVASLSLGDLEAMASNAISRWIVLQSERLHREDWPQEDPIATLLLG